jgi:hypothetical protein
VFVLIDLLLSVVLMQETTAQIERVQYMQAREARDQQKVRTVAPERPAREWQPMSHAQLDAISEIARERVASRQTQ